MPPSPAVRPKVLVLVVALRTMGTIPKDVSTRSDQSSEGCRVLQGPSWSLHPPTHPRSIPSRLFRRIPRKGVRISRKSCQDPRTLVHGLNAVIVDDTESRLFGPTRNPWNLAHRREVRPGRVPALARILLSPPRRGGSMDPRPRVGLKPTRARNPLGPDRGEGLAGFSCGPVLSISVRDSAAMLDAIHGPEPSSFISRRRRSGLPQEVGRDTARCASPLPTNRPMATPSIRMQRRFAKSQACWPGSAIMLRSAPCAGADPAP